MLDPLLALDRNHEVPVTDALHAQAAGNVRRGGVLLVDAGDNPAHAHLVEADVGELSQSFSHVAAALEGGVERVRHLAGAGGGIEAVGAHGADELARLAELYAEQQVVRLRSGELGGYPIPRLPGFAMGCPIQESAYLGVRRVLEHVGSILQPQGTQDEPFSPKPLIAQGSEAGGKDVRRAEHGVEPGKVAIEAAQAIGARPFYEPP